MRFGDYEPADEAYAGWAEKLAKRADAHVSPDVRVDIARFYANRRVQSSDDDDRDLDAALARLAVAGRGRASVP